MAGFLLMLDSTILVTVSSISYLQELLLYTYKTLGHPEYHQPLQFSEGHWLVWQRISYDNVSLATSAKDFFGQCRYNANQSRFTASFGENLSVL